MNQNRQKTDVKQNGEKNKKQKQTGFSSGSVSEKFDELSPERIKVRKKGSGGKRDGAGRYKKEEPEVEEYKPYQLFQKEDLRLAVSIIPFALLAGLFKDKKWLLDDSEKDYLAPKLDKVIMKYAPAVTTEYKEELDLAISLSVKIIIHYQKESEPVETEPVNEPESAFD